jgi:hypothetical protein
MWRNAQITANVRSEPEGGARASKRFSNPATYDPATGQQRCQRRLEDSVAVAPLVRPLVVADSGARGSLRPAAVGGSA